MPQDLDVELFRRIFVDWHPVWLNPVIRVVADSGLGQVQAAALFWPLSVNMEKHWRWLLVGVGAAICFFTGSGFYSLVAYALLAWLLADLPTWVGWRALVTGLIAGAIRLPLAKSIGRLRPSNLGFGEPLEPLYAANSFPSGHSTTVAALSVVIFLAMYRTPHKRVAWMALGYALFVGIARVMSGVHYPTDVLGGWALGAAVAAAVAVLWPPPGPMPRPRPDSVGTPPSGGTEA